MAGCEARGRIEVAERRLAAGGALRRAARAAVLSPIAAAALTGCYGYRRVDGTNAAPLVGKQVALDINDRGRVALADSLGPSPGRVEGRLVSADDSTISLAVSAVRPLRGERATWTGERVTLRRSSVNDVLERRVSLARSLALGAAAVGGVVLFLVSVDLLGGGGGDGGERRPGGGTNEQ